MIWECGQDYIIVMHLRWKGEAVYVAIIKMYVGYYSWLV